jgi:hypothetical protein
VDPCDLGDLEKRQTGYGLDRAEQEFAAVESDHRRCHVHLEEVGWLESRPLVTDIG